MSIDGIFVSPEASKPMLSLQEGTLVTGRGLAGDRYHNYVGTYSHIRISKRHPGEREPGRQLTLISADSLDAAFEAHNLPKPKSYGDIRRNIVLRGVSSEELLAGAGHVVQLGPTCRVLIHRHCVPCMYNERKNGIPGMMEAIWNESGVSCEVLVGGSIAVGDVVQILENDKGEVDDGNQPPGYYVPPSKRTTAMVMGSMQCLREMKVTLAEIDPEGVERVEASYSTVGLTFWPREMN